MKASEIYRKAAVLIEDGSEDYCCRAISKIETGSGLKHSPARTAFKKLFGLGEGSPADGWYGATVKTIENGSGGFTWVRNDEAQDARIVALCLAAAIAADAEKRGKPL